MAFNSFCGLLTLQVGVAILATTFFVVSIIVLIVNVFDYEKHPTMEWPVNLFFVIIFAILMIIAGGMMFFAAYNESRTSCLKAIILIIIIFAFWLVLSIFSYVNNPSDLKLVCVKTRCGEGFWLVNLQYRGYGGNDWIWEYDKNKTSGENDKPPSGVNNETDTSQNDMNEGKTSAKPGDSKFSDRKQMEDARKLDLFDSYFKDLEVKLQSSNDFRHKFGLGMVGAVLISVANVLFFVFTVMILYGYMQELQYPYIYE